MERAAGKVFSPLNAFYPQDPLRVSHPQVLFASLLRASPQGLRLPGPHRSPMTVTAPLSCPQFQGPEALTCLPMGSSLPGTQLWG